MTLREKFIAALERKPITGRVPTFELVFFLTMEKFGRVHPSHLALSQWHQMSASEKNLYRHYAADTYIMTAKTYGHNAIHVHPIVNEYEEIKILLELIREKSGYEYYLSLDKDPTFSIPDGDGIYEFSYRLIDEPDKLKAEAEEKVDDFLEFAQRFENKGLVDGFTMCCDYCFNVGPFLSPEQFAEFVAPYLGKTIKNYRDMGYYTIKHTDGNIMPIIDQIVECNPHALHSIDPQAGVDIAEVKRLYGDKICLVGNVNCGLMQTGTEAETVASARYALENGMPNYGYIFSTSNCAYTGMPLERYELILDVLEKEGIYK